MLDSRTLTKLTALKNEITSIFHDSKVIHTDADSIIIHSCHKIEKHTLENDKIEYRYIFFRLPQSELDAFEWTACLKQNSMICCYDHKGTPDKMRSFLGHMDDKILFEFIDKTTNRSRVGIVDTNELISFLSDNIFSFIREDELFRDMLLEKALLKMKGTEVSLFVDEDDSSPGIVRIKRMCLRQEDLAESIICQVISMMASIKALGSLGDMSWNISSEKDTYDIHFILPDESEKYDILVKENINLGIGLRLAISGGKIYGHAYYTIQFYDGPFFVVKKMRKRELLSHKDIRDLVRQIEKGGSEPFSEFFDILLSTSSIVYGEPGSDNTNAYASLVRESVKKSRMRLIGAEASEKLIKGVCTRMDAMRLYTAWDIFRLCYDIWSEETAVFDKCEIFFMDMCKWHISNASRPRKNDKYMLNTLRATS